MVKAKQVVGRLEDSVPQLQKKAAEAEAKAAKHKAESMETINFMIKAAAFSRAAYDKAVESNRIAAKAVSEIEVKEKYLAYEKDLAQIARERETQTQDKLVAEAKAVEVDNAQKAIERRQITSPYDGYVEEIKPHLGEWVKAGDVIFKVKKIDTLRIDGLFNVKRNTVVNLYQLPNREVEVEFEDVKNGQLRRVPGRVVNVNLSSDGGEEYRMRVEVTNIKDPETNQWVVRPGMLANIVLTPGAK
jgi:multidrug efflux pump subunit AcrA (membrane-fusion protein)